MYRASRSYSVMDAIFLDTVCPSTVCLAQCLAPPLPTMSSSTGSVRLGVGKRHCLLSQSMPDTGRDTPCGHQRFPQGHIQNNRVWSTHRHWVPALLTWSRPTNNSKPPLLSSHTAPVGPRLPGSTNIFPKNISLGESLPQRGLSKGKHKFQNCQPPPCGQ